MTTPEAPAAAVLQSLPVAAIQMVSSTDPEANLEHAGRLIAQAAAGGASMVVLPEYFCLLGRKDTDKVALREPDGDGPLQSFLSAQAAEHGIWLVGGTVPLACARPSRVRNACLVYGPDGRRRARYDKIHLFGLSRGDERFDESATIEAGRTPVVFDAGPWRVGLSVCYDLRFPELYRRLLPVDLIVVPSAFTYTTGSAHWEILLRARAIENQCYVLAPAQGGLHENGRRTWGHSMLVDPWGEVLAVQAEGEGVVAGLLDRRRIDEARRSLPALRHRLL
ncbi:carbon-nitrogen hydrolase family protein [Quisquiliibacterium transsilvanicum]|uniref:Nitrilase n=1 Tax=Quisquiliibacterium transsilvanicum TaxID=1549638 RepID=A0A7W8M8F0_9BURK|nr:carbon-nitrogen hydrolase family protein [Quisquiliibacterium transsilvanicum]MBB5271572.1 nitrilase [Quisquiliibacterium transsilvanicum]